MAIKTVPGQLCFKYFLHISKLKAFWSLKKIIILICDQELYRRTYSKVVLLMVSLLLRVTESFSFNVTSPLASSAATNGSNFTYKDCLRKFSATSPVPPTFDIKSRSDESFRTKKQMRQIKKHIIMCNMRINVQLS